MQHSGRSRRPALAAALVLLLASCGGGGSSGSSTATGDPGTTAVDGSATSSTEPGATTSKKKKTRIERPSGTPLGEVIPPGHDAYLLLSQGRCSELLGLTGTWRQGSDKVDEDVFFLYRAAAEACLQRWDAAQSDFQRLLNLDPSFNGNCDSANCERCMRAVQEWLTQVLATRRSEPGSDIEYVKGTQSSPCPAPGRGKLGNETTTTTDETTETTDEETTTSQRSGTSAPTTAP